MVLWNWTDKQKYFYVYQLGGLSYVKADWLRVVTVLVVYLWKTKDQSVHFQE